MTNNAEKLFSMITMEAIKVRETKDLKEIEEFYLEVQRFIKTEYKKLEDMRTELYLEVLDGKEEGVVNGWLASYKEGTRFALDAKKLSEYFKNNGIEETEMKNLIYSHNISKKSLKLKNIK